MKTPRIVKSIGYIDDDLVSGAAENPKVKKIGWMKWSALAACLAVMAIVGAGILPTLFNNPDKPITEMNNLVAQKYKYQLASTEADVEWPWEYKTNGEKYHSVNFNGKAYRVKSFNPIGEDLLGENLGTYQVEGVDANTRQTYTETFTVRKINNVSDIKLIAAGNENGFYVYMFDDTEKPATFGEVLELYGLPNTLEFNHFTVCEGYQNKGYYTVNDDSYIWDTLLKCSDAKLDMSAEDFDRSNRNYLTFTATSDALGVYNRAIYISEDGYFATNIFDYSYVYFIGKDAAGKIINYAKSNCVESESTEYTLTIPGTLIEIGDGYVMIDDTILCANEKDGTVYKVKVDDIRMKRCVECLNIEVGDIVCVKYDGVISENNEVSGAYSMYEGTLIDGDLTIAE